MLNRKDTQSNTIPSERSVDTSNPTKAYGDSNPRTTQPPRNKKVSNLWYMLPLLFETLGGLGFIGGIIGYLFVKGNNRMKAIKLLIEGFILTGIWLIILRW